MTDIQIAICIIVACAVACYVIVLVLPIERESDWVGETLVDWDEFKQVHRDPDVSKLCCTHHMDAIEGHVDATCEFYDIDPETDECMRDAVVSFLVHKQPPTREEFEQELERLWEIS